MVLRLVVDANVLIAAFLRDSTVRRLVTGPGLQLFVPEFIFEEFEAHLGELRRKTKLPADQQRELLGRLSRRFTRLPQEMIEPHLSSARRAMEHIDPHDSVYLAATMALSGDGIWSDDSHFKEQETVACWTTAEVIAAIDGPRARK